MIVGINCLASKKLLAAPSQLRFPTWPVMSPPGVWTRAYKQTYLRGVSRESQTRPDITRFLLRNGSLSEVDLAAAQAISLQNHQPLIDVLLERNLVTAPDLLKAHSQVEQIPIERLNKYENQFSPELISLIPAQIARTFSLLPLEQDNGVLILAMKSYDRELVSMVEAITNLKVEARLVDARELDDRITQLYSPAGPHAWINAPCMTDLLMAMKTVTQSQLDNARKSPWLEGDRFGQHLVHMGLLDEVDLAEMLSLQTGIPYSLMEHAHFDSELMKLIPGELVQRHAMIPFYACGTDLWVAVADPMDADGLKTIELITGMRAWPIIAPRSAIVASGERFYGVKVHTLDPRLHKLVSDLVARGILNQSGATSVLNCYVKGQMSLDKAILEATPISETKVYKTLSELSNVPLINLQLQEATTHGFDPLGQPVVHNVVHDPVDETVARMINLETAQELGFLPVKIVNGRVLAAFANPFFEPVLPEVEALLGMPVQPYLVPRSMLDEATQRIYRRKNIGSYLLLAGVISRSQLNDALEFAQQTGVHLGQALINRGYVTQEQLYQFLAIQSNLPYFDLTNAEIDPETARLIDPEVSRAHGILPLSADEETLTLAMVDPLNNEAIQIAGALTGHTIQPVLVTDQDMETVLERLFKQEYLTRSISQLLERSPEDSAYRVLSRGQRIALLIFAILSVIWLALNASSYLIIINALFTIFYLAFTSYKFYLIYRALNYSLEVPVSDEEVKALNDRDLPVYTVLVPSYREALVLPAVLASLSKLDYPSTKLDIKVLMELDDQETIDAFYANNPAPHIHGIIVPSAQPKTKPKACNYGLIHARGDYVVIFDAEDLPEPGQLKRALIAFSKAPPEVVCIQAKLNYYNRNQNLLTRWFTVEYSMWFDLFLPGLDASGAPIPLGGTSNHFKKAALVECGAWDPYNVTEDADLGIRLYKRGYKTAIVDSTTFEEANSYLYNWIRQRSRWIKGYIQTWLVHMRHPVKLYKEIGPKAFLGFQFVVGGTFFTAILNPIYWLLTTLWFIAKWGFIESIYPGIIFYLGAICLLFGNFAFTYMNVAGAMRRNYYDMVKYALISPLYWGLMSVAGWRGFLQLINKPHFWEKTIHGLYSPEENNSESEENGTIKKIPDNA
jgi:cellulose synthase/poly-beta-1,6-N-acetylglucosamine synthase-like glycosyltransferase